MKSFVLSLLMLFALNGLQAQSKKELSAMLMRDLDAYNRYTLAGNFEQSLLYMPPKMFDIIPRDSLLATLKQSMDNEFMTIQFTALSFNKHQPKIKKAGDYYWALTSYDGSMRIDMKGEPSYKTLVFSMMKGKFGSENVEQISESAISIALKDKKIIAYKDPAIDNWLIIQDKRFEKGEQTEMQKIVLETVIPEPIRKAMKMK